MNSEQGIFNESIHVSTRVNNFRFRSELIDQRIEKMRKDDPALRKMSYDCIAEKIIGLSRSVFFRIRTKALTDPKTSSTWLISSALDIPVCELLGLPSHESVHGSAADRALIEQQDKEIIQLRTELKNALEKCAHFEKMYNERSSVVSRLHKDLANQRKLMAVILIAMIVVSPVLVYL